MEQANIDWKRIESVFLASLSRALHLAIAVAASVMLVENGRLRYINSITKRFVELTMAHKGEVKVIVTSVIVVADFVGARLNLHTQRFTATRLSCSSIFTAQNVDPKRKSNKLVCVKITKMAATAGRLRWSLFLFTKVLRSDSLASQRSALHPQLSKGFTTASGQKEQKVKMPLVLFGGTGNYASALYLAAVNSNALEKVQYELLDLVEASSGTSTFSQFTKDPSVPADVRVKAINDICAQAKFSDITKNFLVMLAENGRLRYINSITKRFVELTMAHKGEVKVIVTSVIPLPLQEEKELKETLQDIFGQGKKVKLEQRIDPSILGGLVVEFGQKLFDMSIKTRARQMERFLREPAHLGTL